MLPTIGTITHMKTTRKGSTSWTTPLKYKAATARGERYAANGARECARRRGDLARARLAALVAASDDDFNIF